MMNHQNLKKSPIIPVVSILVLLAFFANVFMLWNRSDMFTKDVIGPLLIQTTILIPVIIGLWKLVNRGISKGVLIGFIVYGLLTVLGYANVMSADDPIGAGLPMVVIVMPYAIGFSLYLFKKINHLPILAS